ncbi:MAG: tetratricopeptide repeat protein [Acetobacteraceae bacterium]
MPCQSRAGKVRPISVGLGVVDIFDEVSEDLRADRARYLFKRYGYLLALAAVLIVFGVAGLQAWRWQQTHTRDAVAVTFLTATRDAAGEPARALDAFARLADEGPEGYRTLARLRAATLQAARGDLPAALAYWDQVSADTEADPQLRDLANMLWVQHQVDAGDPAAVQGRLAPLVAPGNPWRPMALESQAWLLLRTGETDKARDILRQLVGERLAPDGVKARAAGLLTQMGERVAAPTAPGGAGG